MDGAGLPRILFSIAEGGYHGRLAVLGGGDEGWQVHGAPMAIARAGLAHVHVGAAGPGGGEWVGVTYDGANRLSLWSHEGGERWEREHEWAEARTVVAHGVEGDGRGRVHMAPFGGNGGPVQWVVRDGDGLGESVQIAARGQHAVVATDPAGGAHFSWWSSEGGRGWELMYSASDPVAPEVVAPLGGGALSVQSHGLTVERSGIGETQVHLLGAVGQPLALTHLRRDADGRWRGDELAVDEPDEGCQGGEQPEEGVECEQDSVQYVPLDAVSSGDHRHVRMLYSRIHRHAKLRGQCQGGGGMPPFCDWQVVESSVDASLHLAWPTPDGGTGSAQVHEGVGGAGTAVVDAEDRIHVALYDVQGLRLVYLRLDP